VFKDPAIAAKAVTYPDLRIWIREQTIMKKLFEKIGFSLICDYYDIIPHAKRIFNYLQAPQNDEYKKQFGFKCYTQFDNELTGTDITPFSLVLSKEGSISTNYNSNSVEVSGYDNGLSGYYSNATQQGTGLSGIFKIKAQLFCNYNGDGPTTVQVLKNNIVVGSVSFAQNANSNNFENAIGTSDSFDVVPTDIITFVFELRNFTGIPNGIPYTRTIGKGTSIEFLAQNIELNEGLNEPIRKFVNPSIKGIDLLKGIAHPMNAHFEISYLMNTIKMLVPYDVNGLEGYYRNRHIDLRGKQITNTENIQYPTNIANRYKKFKYKDYVNKDVSDTKYQKIIDLGEQYLNDTDNFENPTYQAFSQITYARLCIGGQEIKLADLRQGNDSAEIQDSDLILRGIAQNGTPANVAQGIAFWTFKSRLSSSVSNDFLDYFPSIYMIAEGRYNGTTIDENIVYGNDLTTNTDMVSQFWEKYLIDTARELQINDLFLLSYSDVRKLNFRDKYIIMSKGKSILARLTEISDYKHSSSISVPLNFRKQ
jgi:hypothetical protein